MTQQERDIETHYFGDGHDHGEPADDEKAPDAWNPRDECLAWVKTPQVIGAPSHHHVCRQSASHKGTHLCGCGVIFVKRSI